MHYRNGREAKNGDKVIQLQMDGPVIITLGVLYDATPGNDYCNGHIAPTQPQPAGACMCDCLHVDDLAAILSEKGLARRPVIPIAPPVDNAHVADGAEKFATK